MIGRDAISAGKRRLEPAAQTCTMDCRDYRNPKSFQRIQQHLTVSAQPLRVAGGFELQKFLDVCPRDPDVGLAADEHRGVYRRVPLQSGYKCDELVLYCAAQLVD